jgi:hypothetical protein
MFVRARKVRRSRPYASPTDRAFAKDDPTHASGQIHETAVIWASPSHVLAGALIGTALISAAPALVASLSNPKTKPDSGNQTLFIRDSPAVAVV